MSYVVDSGLGSSAEPHSGVKGGKVADDDVVCAARQTSPVHPVSRGTSKPTLQPLERSPAASKGRGHVGTSRRVEHPRVPALQELCIQTLQKVTAYIVDVDWPIGDEQLAAILKLATPPQLQGIEHNTHRDISNITNPLWFNLCVTANFGHLLTRCKDNHNPVTPGRELAMNEVQKGALESFRPDVSYRRLYEALSELRAARQSQVGEKLRVLYRQASANKEQKCARLIDPRVSMRLSGPRHATPGSGGGGNVGVRERLLSKALGTSSQLSRAVRQDISVDFGKRAMKKRCLRSTSHRSGSVSNSGSIMRKKQNSSTNFTRHLTLPRHHMPKLSSAHTSQSHASQKSHSVIHLPPKPAPKSIDKPPARPELGQACSMPSVNTNCKGQSPKRSASQDTDRHAPRKKENQTSRLQEIDLFG